MARRFHWTRGELLAAPPREKPYVIYDDDPPQLAARINPGGKKSFHLARRIAGQWERIQIGEFPLISIDEARRTARVLLGRAESAINPAAERRRARHEPALEDIWRDYLHEHLQPRTRGWRDTEGVWTNHLAGAFGRRRLSAISKHDVIAWHARVGRRYPRMANRALALLRQLYAAAAEREIGDGRNPAAGVRKFAERPRERWLSLQEARRLFRALEECPHTPTAELVRLALFTAARLGNLLSARFEHMDLETGTWLISAAAAKAGKPILIPLLPEAVQLVKRRRLAVYGAYLFPARVRDGDAARPMTFPTGPWQDLRRAAELEDFHFHDLRHSAATWMRRAGASDLTLRDALAHADVSTTQIYAHGDTEQTRAALAAGLRAMMAK